MEAGVNGFICTDDFHCGIGASSAGPFEDECNGVLGFCVDGVRSAEGASESEFFVFEIDCDNFVEAGEFEGLDTEQADHPGADDNDATAEGFGGTIGGVNGDGDRFDHCGVFEGEGVGDFVEDIYGYGDEFSEGTLASKFFTGDTEDLAIFAEVHRSAAAEVAFPAGDG
jgi:hypothetical protein